MRRDYFAALLSVTSGLCLLLLSAMAIALPEDATQPIETESLSSELLLEEGIVIYHGSDAKPATVSQGTLVITGAEIRIVRKNEVLQSVTASGKPARFQQQPAADQELIHASGELITLDNSTRVLTIETSAEFSQAGNTMSAPHIDYNLDTRRANASGSADGLPVRMSMPPTPGVP
jgi:lipopolysaccharide export system protein LptA